MNKIDFNSVEQFFNLVYVPGCCCEVRCLNAEIDKSRHIVRSKNEWTVAGWFTDPAELSCEIARVENVSCYITVNPVSLARRPSHAKNTLKVLSGKRGEFCVDSDIVHINFLILDIDPVRPPGNPKVNSSDSELHECLAVKNKIVNELEFNNNCLHGISGNGAFILLSLPSYPRDDDSIINISKFINQIAKTYSNERCTIDTNTKNPSRQLAIPGTWKFKDVVSTQERPHRQVAIQGGKDATLRSFRSQSMGSIAPIPGSAS